MENVRVIGGNLTITDLHSDLDGVDYEVSKVHIWLNMLKDMKCPKNWSEANKEGTDVEFVMINSEEDYLKGREELESFIERVNLSHGLDLHIGKKK